MSITSVTARVVALVCAGALLVAGCGGGDSPTQPAAPTPAPPSPPPAPTVSAVEVSPNTATLEVGKTQRFVATAKASGGNVISGVDFSWSSSNTAVATINSNGVATAVAAGTTTIRATGNGVSSAAVTITVTVAAVANVTVSPASTLDLMVGEMVTFSAMARTAGGVVRGDVSISWVSSDTSVVTITSAGVATAVGAGSAMVRAAVDGITSSPVTIKVAEPPPPEPVVATVTVNPAVAMIETDATQQFSATALTSDGMEISDVEFTWSSSDEMIATVDASGLATGVGSGEAMITATADSLSGTATLTVTEPPPPAPVVARVTVSPPSMKIMVGDMFQFTAVATTSDSLVIEDVDFTWMSDDSEVATVDGTGLITAIAAGTAMITATGDDVTSKPATVTVEESAPVVASVEIVDAVPVMLVVGDRHQLTAAARTTDDTRIAGVSVSFVWSSDDNKVATVDSTGLVTAVGAGMANISVMVDGISSEAIRVTVSEPPPVVSRVTVTPATATIEERDTRRFIANAYDSDDTEISGKTFSWTSSRTSVARVSPSSGPATIATGIDAGTTTITATVDGVSGNATLRVNEPPPPPPPPPPDLVVARIAVSPSSPSIVEGDTQRFTATAYESDNTEIPGKSFIWTSSRTSVARVSPSSGPATTATGVDAGTTTITATVDGTSGTATLTVIEPPPVVSRVAVSPSSPSIEVGETQRFTATAYESDNTVITGKTFTWTSSRISVARISPSSGPATTATGVDAGTTTITATVDGTSGTATLTVTEPPPVVSRVAVSPSSPSIEEGETQQFTATAYEADDTEIPGKSFTWKSSMASVATINSSGLASAKEAGTTTITATVDGTSGTATLTVTEPPPVVDRVTVSPSSRSIEEGETQQFTATAYEADDTEIPGKSFTWKSSMASVATINSSGLATAKEAGTTTITATVDGTSGTATLTVTEPPPVVDRVTVSPLSRSIEVGETQRFTATAYESDNTVITGKTFTWTSSNTTVATINSSGLATAKEAGSTTIRASVDGTSGTATLTVTEPPPPPPMSRSKTGSISGRNNYNSGGSVTLREISGGKLELKITGLSTPGGAPDVFVALYTDDDINWPKNGSLPAGARGFGEVSRQSGTKTWAFTPASGEDIDSWDYLILHCRLINSEVGSASLSK